MISDQCLLGVNPSSPSPGRYNQKALSLDFLELLECLIPTEYEMRLICGYESEGGPVGELSKEGRFMVPFSQILRLPQHISTLTFMGNFPDSVQLIQAVRRVTPPPVSGGGGGLVVEAKCIAGCYFQDKFICGFHADSFANFLVRKVAIGCSKTCYK